MRLLTSALVLSYLYNFSAAQSVTVPSTCEDGYTAGTDEVLLTIPYSYSKVMSIIGSYQDLTWSGNPPNTVTLNGTDNKVGTARTYNTTAGSHIVETLLTYSKPASGPYVEVHNTATFSVSAYNISIYIPFDGTVVTSECAGRASSFNFTARYCSNNATVAGVVLHQTHLTDGLTVGMMLGGEKFTTCDAISSGITGNSTNCTSSSYSGNSTTSSGGGGNWTLNGNCTSPGANNSTSTANGTSTPSSTVTSGSGSGSGSSSGSKPTTTTYHGAATGTFESNILTLSFMSILAAAFVVLV